MPLQFLQGNETDATICRTIISANNRCLVLYSLLFMSYCILYKYYLHATVEEFSTMEALTRQFFAIAGGLPEIWHTIRQPSESHPDGIFKRCCTLIVSELIRKTHLLPLVHPFKFFIKIFLQINLFCYFYEI